MDNGNGIAIGWLGYPTFKNKGGHELLVFCMPTLFETFTIVLVDRWNC